MRSRTHKKQFWFNDEENNALILKAEQTGMTESDIIRNLVLDNSLKEKPDDRFYQSIQLIRNVANNLNQIAKRAHSFGFIDEQIYFEEVEKLDEFIEEIKSSYLNKNIK